MRPQHWLYTIPLRIRSLFKRHAADTDLDEELQFHLEQKTQELIFKGLSEKDARYAALREFGGVEQSKEKARDARKVNLILDLAQDLRFGARMLRKNPGFSSIAILTLALGIGANAAIFSVVNAVLLRPLPYPSPDRIVAIAGASPVEFAAQGGQLKMTWAKWTDDMQSLDRIAVYSTGDLNLAAGGAEPERVAAAEVSRNFFDVFGLPPIAGRTLLKEEDVPGHPSIAVLSATLCSRFGAPSDVIGKILLMNGKPTEVVGVMPFGFEFPEKTLVWVPTAWASSEHLILNQAIFHTVVGRMKPGVFPAQASLELAAIQSRALGEAQKLTPGKKFPNARKVIVILLHDQLAGSSKSALLILLGAVGFVLLIACADVANLLLARAVHRQREIALRAALGASRLRLVRQGLTESILLSSIGGLGGLVLAYVSLDAIRRFIPPGMLFVQSIALDWHVLLFLMCVSGISGLIFGLFPVLHALRIDINEPLKESAASSPYRHSFLGRTRNLLAISEIAMALVLLAGAGLLIKSFWRLTNIDTGFRPESVLSATITLPLNEYKKNDQRATFYDEALRRISALPGVTAASVVSDLPFGRVSGISFRLKLEQETPAHQAREDQNFAAFYSASSDYFRAMGIRLIAGRIFNDGDRAGAHAVVIINNAIAQMFWPGENPLGRRVSLPGNSDQPTNWAEIVGIVGDSKHRSLSEEFTPEYYIPAQQAPPSSAFLVVRLTGDPGTTVNAIRRSVARMDSTLPLSTFISMNARISESVAEPRFRTLLLGIFAALALILAAAGIYGVMSYNVAQRTREIGIRIAMGAGRSDVLSLILGQSLKLTLVGVAVGLAASWGLTRLLASVLYNVTPHDFSTLSGVSILLSAVALFASYIPARRAMRVDPLVALRYE